MKTRLILLTLACLLVAAPATAQVNYAVSGNTAYVTSSPGATGAIVIASTYNGYPVTSIGYYAFYNNTALTSATIPNSVTRIASILTVYMIRGAFEGCTSLTNLIIGNNVTGIEDKAFSGCTSLTSVTIGSSVTRIANASFSGCTGLGSVTIPNSVTRIGISPYFAFLDGPFQGCTGLTNLILGNSVNSIENSAFAGCTRLTSVTIPNSVGSIGEATFASCTGLTNVTIPNSVTSKIGRAHV